MKWWRMAFWCQVYGESPVSKTLESLFVFEVTLLIVPLRFVWSPAFVSFIGELFLGNLNQCLLITGPVKLDQLNEKYQWVWSARPLGCWVNQSSLSKLWLRGGQVHRHILGILDSPSKKGVVVDIGRENLTISVSVNIMAVKPGSYRVRQSSILSNIYVLCLSPQVFDHAEFDKLTLCSEMGFFGIISVGPAVSKG